MRKGKYLFEKEPLRKHKNLTNEELDEVNEFLEKRKVESNQPLTQRIVVNIKCKSAKQKELINSIKENEITICYGPPGCGKAQPLYSKVLTPKGWVTMGELNVGDVVTTPNGESANILNVFPQGKKDTYRITFSDGRVVESCDEHLWKVYNRDWKEKYKVLTLGEIMSKYGHKIDEGRIYVPLVESTNNTDIDLPIDPYLLGCLIGDGGMTTNTLTFSTEDEYVLEELSPILSEDGYGLKKLKHGRYDYIISSDEKIKPSGKKGVYSNLFKSKLYKLGLMGKKSSDKFIPEIYKKSSKRQKIKLIQGLMDTDGTTRRTNCSVSFSTSSKQLCDDFIDVVRSIGGICNVTEKTPKYTYNGEYKEGLKSYNIGVRYSKPSDLFNLKRKKDICNNYQYENLNLRIEKVDYVGKVDSKCIRIDSDEHLYITDDYVVTHNTYLSCAQSLKMLKMTPEIGKIYLVKSVTTLRNEEIGFLKGTMDEKMAPFMFSFMNNFEKLIGKGLTRTLKENNYIEYLPIAYMRGINIDNAVIIIDEAQNISIQNLKTIMTRLGENSRMIFLGDTKQKDIKNKKDSALEFLFDQFSDVNKIGVVSLGLEDVVRNPLIKDIERVFDKVEEKTKKESQPQHHPIRPKAKTPLKYRWLRLKSSVKKLFR